MITDENHREIVQKLREACDEIERTGNGLTVWELTDILGIRDDDSSAMEGLNIDDARRLADLIDRPTCHLVLTDIETHGNAKVRCYECSECGGACEEIYGKYERCPHCGAVVIDED
nr:MAG TPA: hydrogenase/urease nickel incorporation protein [Caudoviricetes sp.]